MEQVLNKRRQSRSKLTDLASLNVDQTDFVWTVLVGNLSIYNVYRLAVFRTDDFGQEYLNDHGLSDAEKQYVKNLLKEHGIRVMCKPNTFGAGNLFEVVDAKQSMYDVLNAKSNFSRSKELEQWLGKFFQTSCKMYDFSQIVG
jgi:hypothetical protein